MVVPAKERPIKTVSAKQRKMRNNLIAYSFIAPNFIGFAVLTLVPILSAVVLSFANWNGTTQIQWVGLGNYAKLFGDRIFKQSFLNTIIYSVATVPLTIVASLALAVLLNRKLFARNFFRTVSFFPYVASMVAVAAVWNALFDPNKGMINETLSALGVQNPPRWIADPHWAMVDLILFSVWKMMGYYMIIYLAGLQGINPELYEAASLDGANGWQRFRFVTLPQLSSTTFFVLMMVIIQCFKVYDIVYMITQGGPGTATYVLVYDIYQVAFRDLRYGYASAISMVLFVLVLAITIVQFRVEKRRQN
ncbi:MULTISPECIES: carbohydrate ABC transporter permease [Caproicibacterium]|uniref:Sugar ABC transporter permease n=1 Tax=Caproicibacterium argilliputei TaxID=3030016 RepID=A0AA97DCP3_9FIRM|nr:sugar ABC transporter permease [Caproicibacterium argilliputei]WOC33128.1 sugar ABC transporter permease [Caproicibacterium argilliputei]